MTTNVIWANREAELTGENESGSILDRIKEALITINDAFVFGLSVLFKVVHRLYKAEASISLSDAPVRIPIDLYKCLLKLQRRPHK